jgi:excisionase family DNA binding protein
LRPSSPARHRRQPIDAGQFPLPFFEETETATTPVSKGQDRTVVPRRTRRSSGKRSISEHCNAQNLREKPKGNEKNARRIPTRKASVPPDAKLAVSRVEAAEIVSLSIRSIDNLLATKKLPFRKVGTRILIPVTELRKFIRVDHPDRMAS